MTYRILLMLTFVAVYLASSRAVPMIARGDEKTITNDDSYAQPHVVVRNVLTSDQVREAIYRGQYELAKYHLSLKQARVRAQESSQN